MDITPVTSIDDEQTQPRLTIEPSVTAPDGSFWVFNGTGYDKVVDAWSVEQHIRPAAVTARLGDVRSWVQYVERYHQPDRLLLSWSERGLRAILDFHQTLDAPGRAQWTAEHPFVTSSQWNAWTGFADGKTAWSQQQTVNKLDELADDVVSPVASEILDIIRTLRTTVKLAAKSDMREDGGSELSWSKDSAVTSKRAIPSEIVISIPVLKGHVRDADETILVPGEDGKAVERVLKAGTPVNYGLPVKVRPSVDDDGKTSFRFLLPTAERVLEAVYADRVNAAKALLGSLGESLYRATA